MASVSPSARALMAEGVRRCVRVCMGPGAADTLLTGGAGVNERWRKWVWGSVGYGLASASFAAH